MHKKQNYIFLGFCFLVLLALYRATIKNYLVFHSLIEFAIIVVLFMVANVAFMFLRIIRNRSYIFIGTSFFFVGIVEIFHTLAYKGMNVFPGITANVPTQLWILARYMESMTLLLAPLFSKRRLSFPVLFSSLLAITTLGLLSVFFFKNFPDCYIEGMGLTRFKIVSEYFIALILIAAILLFFRQRESMEREILRDFVIAIALSIASGLSFTTYVSVYAMSNAMGHIFKALSSLLFLLIFVKAAIEKPVKLLFSEVESDRSRLRTYLENLPIMVVALDRKGMIRMINGKGRELLKVSQEQALGKSWFENFIPEEDREKARKVFEDIMNGNIELRERNENYIITKTGERRVMDFRNTLLLNESGSIDGVLSSAEDITDKKEFEKQLKDLATKDPLTGVLNKREGLRALSITLEKCKDLDTPLSICFIDMDYLKEVNDNYGHEAGDNCIKKLAKTIQESVRENDYVIRFGGDEFIIALYNCPKEQAETIMQRIIAKMKSPEDNFNLPFTPDISYGIVCSKELSMITIDELIRIADKRMYEMKKIHHKE